MYGKYNAKPVLRSLKLNAKMRIIQMPKINCKIIEYRISGKTSNQTKDDINKLSSSDFSIIIIFYPGWISHVFSVQF